MKSKPILFSAPMIRAILGGTKSQTRRIVKPPRGWPQYSHCDPFARPPAVWWWHGERECVGIRQECPYGQPGDRLWVKETWAVGKCADGLKPSMLHAETWLSDNGGLWYAAGGEPKHPISPEGKTRASLFMPRWASRITLEITGIRVKRLHNISESDARAEGTPGGHGVIPGYGYNATAGEHYRWLWKSLHGADSWDANPFVWVVEFRRGEA